MWRRMAHDEPTGFLVSLPSFGVSSTFVYPSGTNEVAWPAPLPLHHFRGSVWWWWCCSPFVCRLRLSTRGKVQQRHIHIEDYNDVNDKSRARVKNLSWNISKCQFDATRASKISSQILLQMCWVQTTGNKREDPQVDATWKTKAPTGESIEGKCNLLENTNSCQRNVMRKVMNENKQLSEILIYLFSINDLSDPEYLIKTRVMYSWGDRQLELQISRSIKSCDSWHENSLFGTNPLCRIANMG